MIPAIVSDVLVICPGSLSRDLVKPDKLLAFDEDLCVTTFLPNPETYMLFNLIVHTQQKKNTRIVP